MGSSYTCRSGRTQEGEGKVYQSPGREPTGVGDGSTCHALLFGRGADSVAARGKVCCWRDAEGLAGR